MPSVTVLDTDSVKARDLLTKIDDNDILTQTMECVADVYVENCFYEFSRRFDSGAFDMHLRLLGKVKRLFIEDDEYDPRKFPCGTKEISYADAVPVMVRYELTHEEKGHLIACGADLAGYEPPSNMRYNTIQIPLLIEYKAMYESPLCFARIIRPNEIVTSTKKSGYYGLFKLVPEHPDVIRERENGGIDVSLDKTLPEPRLEVPRKVMYNHKTVIVEPEAKESVKQEETPQSVENLREIISEHMADKQAKVDAKASEATLQILHESVQEFNENIDVKSTTNVSDIDLMESSDGASGDVLPYTVRPMNSDLYSVLSQKVDEHAEKVEDARKTDPNVPFNALLDGEKSESGTVAKTKDEKEKQRLLNSARMADIAADNKALNEDASADISGHGATTKKDPEKKKTQAQELLGDIMAESTSPSGQQYL